MFTRSKWNALCVCTVQYYEQKSVRCSCKKRNNCCRQLQRKRTVKKSRTCFGKDSIWIEHRRALLLPGCAEFFLFFSFTGMSVPMERTKKSPGKM